MSIEVQQSLSDNTISHVTQIENPDACDNDAATSPETSSASFENDDDTDIESDYINEEINSDHEFMKEYVKGLFSSNDPIPYEDKARFGDLCKLPEGREWFAKYIDSHRKNIQCVDETTFYKLVYTFALVLFECGVADDYEPAKTLMNMAFTYYYIPDLKQASFSDLTPLESDLNENISPIKTTPTTPKKTSVWQNANQWFKKEVESCKQVFQDTPSFQELKHNVWKKNKNVEKIDDQEDKCISNDVPVNLSKSCSTTSTSTSTFTRSHSASSVGKNYLYEHLNGQSIWKSLRFWNQAFFLAVHTERKKHCSQKEWRMLSAEERENFNLEVSNITFGQLGTFVNNMKCLGLPKDTCQQFLHKQSVIGNISEEQMEMLNEQVEDDMTF